MSDELKKYVKRGANMENTIVKHSAVSDPRVCGIWGNEFLTTVNDAENENQYVIDDGLNIPFQREMSEDHARKRAQERKAIRAAEIAELERQKKIRTIKSTIVIVLSFAILVAAEAICRCPNF